MLKFAFAGPLPPPGKEEIYDPPSRRRNRPNDYTVINRGMELLRSGILAGDLPGRLRDEFGLSPDRARELAGKAKEIYEKLNGTR